MTKYTRKQPSRRDLVRRRVLDLAGGMAVTLIDLAALPLEIRYKGVRLMKKGEFRKIFSRLLDEGELERVARSKYKLTTLGVTRALPEISRQLAGDGKIRVLVFDVPEDKRDMRDAFRRHIKLLGFKKHQQSVWVSRYRCEDWLEQLLDYHKIGSYVSLYIGEHVW